MKSLDSLNLPIYKLRFKTEKGKLFIFDKVRKKYVSLTKEEWVRQNFINYLHKEKGYPLSLMAVEKIVKYDKMNTRADVVLYNRSGDPISIVECKSPKIVLTQDVLYQIAKYNFILKVKYLIITNGIDHFCCKMDYTKEDYTFLKDIPKYDSIN
tara:strand:- start:706 stop:1167 length:462 start_codon:yes stop_codon:yes gene_type:complete